MSNSSDRLRVVLIDENRLRGASIASLISSWAPEHEFEIRQIRAGDVLKEFERSLTCRLVLFSVGGGSIRAVEASGVIRVLHALAPHAKVVVIADREDPEDIISAYRTSCGGFIPTNMEPALALQAIRFILNGGTYFPPSVLRLVAGGGSSEPDDGQRDVNSDPDRGNGDTSVVVNGSGSESTSAKPVSETAVTCIPGNGSEHLSGLTGRQYQVLLCLQKGQSNKLIARELGMTEGTVKVHVRQIMRKVGAANRTQVAILAAPNGGIAVRVQTRSAGRLQCAEVPDLGDSPG
jgi:DNA-binding NarL/FixJ family response regulator